MKKLIVFGHIGLALSTAIGLVYKPVFATTNAIEQFSTVTSTVCANPHILNIKTNTCEMPYSDINVSFDMATAIPSCEQPQEFNPISHTCELPLQKLPVLCHTGQFLNASKTACITPEITCRAPQTLNKITNNCEMPARDSKNTCATGKILNAATLACIDPSSQHETLPQS